MIHKWFPLTRNCISKKNIKIINTQQTLNIFTYTKNSIPFLKIQRSQSKRQKKKIEGCSNLLARRHFVFHNPRSINKQIDLINHQAAGNFVWISTGRFLLVFRWSLKQRNCVEFKIFVMTQFRTFFLKQNDYRIFLFTLNHISSKYWINTIN